MSALALPGIGLLLAAGFAVLLGLDARPRDPGAAARGFGAALALLAGAALLLAAARGI
ncbi:hypothetical protein R5H32_15935 [Defluviimonas sp. D31]|uniref:hypothetical protein n=1 Tax=Defluviimonas sp. D31 TaxID=3083253 RepID=UPI00296F831E|nr:hypothetical protein [Defluviimonas sp. D31]MDW4550852.1 hypothetical protein [Defluviimonas sp. D31]